MCSKTFTIKGNNLQQPVTIFMQRYHQQVHESQYPGGFIRLFEDYSLAEGNNLSVCLRADLNKIDEWIFLIEMIAGGAGSSLFFEWTGEWTENRRIKHFAERLQEFCREQGFVLEL